VGRGGHRETFGGAVMCYLIYIEVLKMRNCVAIAVNAA